MERYALQLREHSLKATPQRAAIAEALDLHGHLSVEELYDLLRQKFTTLSLATIYKNIHIMTQNAFVSEVKLPMQKSVYELTKESHAHLQCQNCQSIEDIMLDMECVVSQAQAKTDFQINSTNLVLSGLCSRCQEK